MARKFRLFPKAETRADDTSDLKNPSAWLIKALGGGKTKAGVTVSSESSLKYTAVLAAVSLRSTLLASFPKQIFQQEGEGKVPIKDSLWRLLAYKPNDWMNAYSFWELNNMWLDLWGNAYNIITRKRGEVVGLSPVHPQFVTPEIVEGKLIYKITGTNSNLDKNHNPKDILHFKDVSTDGIVGKSRISLAAEAIGLGLAAEDFGATFFGKGGHSDAVLEMENSMGDAAYKTFTERWAKNADHGTPLLEHGIKYKNIVIPPENAQFLATREFQVQDIARVFNVPPPLLFDLSHATFSNIEHQDIQFVKYGLRPTVERYESEIEGKLLKTDELGEKEVRFNLDAMLRGDMAARSTFYASAITHRWLNPNEVRKIENFPPYEGGEVYENPNTSSNTNNDGNNNAS
jgi:HK97 family phage portal protein